MINFPKDADNSYDKVTIDGQSYYSFHAVQRDNPDTQFRGTLLKEVSNLNHWAVWTIPSVGYIQIIFYHKEVWEEAYPDAILPE